MAAPGTIGVGAGAGTGAAIGSAVPVIGTGIGAAIGAVVGLAYSLFGNNDNAVISARDKMVRKFRANCLGAKTSEEFPIKKSAGGTLFSQFNLEHSQIDDRKIGGNYDKEWKHVAEFGAMLLFLMYPNRQSLISIDYVNLLKEKKKPDHAFAAVVDYAGPSYQTANQLRVNGGLQPIQNTVQDNITGSQIAANEGSGGSGEPGTEWYKNPMYIGGALLLVLVLFGKKLLRL